MFSRAIQNTFQWHAWGNYVQFCNCSYKCTVTLLGMVVASNLWVKMHWTGLFREIHRESCFSFLPPKSLKNCILSSSSGSWISAWRARWGFKRPDSPLLTSEEFCMELILEWTWKLKFKCYFQKEKTKTERAIGEIWARLLIWGPNMGKGLLPSSFPRHRHVNIFRQWWHQLGR